LNLFLRENLLFFTRSKLDSSNFVLATCLMQRRVVILATFDIDLSTQIQQFLYSFDIVFLHSVPKGRIARLVNAVHLRFGKAGLCVLDLFNLASSYHLEQLFLLSCVHDVSVEDFSRASP
jgi:hypothetical protein